ncbi:MAG: MarC family protein [Parachlamydiaceae bacterium]|nr:MarC family protein [Parachlamydiaceae bacterium]
MTSILALALTFFIVANPLGTSPTILALLKDFNFDRKKKIILRESLFALLLALFFQYFGEFFLSLLKIDDYALMITGGILLFMVALQMLFHQPEITEEKLPKEEPFIVPIATPLISGPGLMTIIMINSRTTNNNLIVTSAILVTWCAVMSILMLAPYLQKILGMRGLAVLEQIMGMLLGLMAMQMMINGGKLFAATLS